MEKLIALIQSIGHDFLIVVPQSTPILLEGLRMTLFVSVVSIAIGLVLGLVVCLMKISKVAVFRAIANFYIWAVRGTPMIVQAYFIFFGVNELVAALFGTRLSIPVASIVTVSINCSAYMAEIYRGGIGAVPKGQTEASRSLGMSHSRTMAKVVLPQAIRISIPPMVNQFIITVKDTSILSVIGLAELTNRARVYLGLSYKFFATWLYVGLFYLAIISLLMIISRKVERSINYDQKK